MSYTFSRRNFMKYTALAAAAVAVSGSLTGCSNPNRPVGKTGDNLKPLTAISRSMLRLLRARSTIIIIPLLHPVWAIPPTPKLKRTVSPRPL